MLINLGVAKHELYFMTISTGANSLSIGTSVSYHLSVAHNKYGHEHFKHTKTTPLGHKKTE